MTVERLNDLYGLVGFRVVEYKGDEETSYGIEEFQDYPQYWSNREEVDTLEEAEAWIRSEIQRQADGPQHP